VSQHQENLPNQKGDVSVPAPDPSLQPSPRSSAPGTTYRASSPVLSTDSTHLVVKEQDVQTLQTDQEDAQVTGAAIDQVVEAVRTDRPLTR
jgi:hypothetical protein